MELQLLRFIKILLNKDDKVLIIDDLIATGGTAEAAAKLVEISGGNVACFIFVINLFDLNGSDNLIKKGYKVENLIEFSRSLNIEIKKNSCYWWIGIYFK